MAGQIPGSARTLPQGFTGGDSSTGGFCPVPDESDGSAPIFTQPGVQGAVGGIGGYSVAPNAGQSSQMAPSSQNDDADKGATSKPQAPAAAAGNCCGPNDKKDDDSKKEEAKQRANDIVKNPQQFEGQNKADVESQLDQELQNDAGWNKAPLNDGSGVKYTSPNGNQQIRLNDGYPGASDPLHSGPYLTSPSTNTRIPLQGNPALGR